MKEDGITLQQGDMVEHFRRQFTNAKDIFREKIYILCEGEVKYPNGNCQFYETTNCITGVSVGVGVEIAEKNPSTQMLFRGIANLVLGRNVLGRKNVASELIRIAGLGYEHDIRKFQPAVTWK